MSKLGLWGLFLMIGGGVIIGFQQISRLVGQSGSYDTLCLVDLFQPDFFNWIDSMTFLGINRLLDTIVMAPIYIILLIVGGVMLIISGFFKS